MTSLYKYTVLLFLLITIASGSDVLQKSSRGTDMTEVQRNAFGTNRSQKQMKLYLRGAANILQTQNMPSYSLMNSDSSRSLYFKGTRENISPCSLTSDTKMDCSSRGLTVIPPPLSANITHLDLNDNLIAVLPDYAFSEYSTLLVLNISTNRLTSLSSCSFCFLSNLIELDLWNNSLPLLNGTYPDDVFKPLFSLRHLRLNMNYKNVTYRPSRYPDLALSQLVNLSHLHMDGLAGHSFGEGFLKLTHLTHLTLAGYLTGYCKLIGLYNTTFENVPYLKYLDLSNCYMLGTMVKTGVFEPLTKLEVLNISHNEDLELETVGRIAYGLQNSSLKRLSMRLVTSRFSFGLCIDSSFVKYLPRTIEYLDVRENNIFAVDRNVIGMLSPSLTEIDLSGNPFVFATYFMDLPLLKNLTTVSLNGASFIYSLPNYYPFRLTVDRYQYHLCTPYGTGEDEISKVREFVLSLPPNLESVEMKNAGLRFRLTNLKVDSNNSLRNLSLHGNYLPVLEGPFNGLNKLEYLDLSSCSIGSISNKFFANLTSLRVLNLGFNFFGSFVSANDDLNPFSMLDNLMVLNLSKNGIEILPSAIFTSLTNLTQLLLNENRLSNFSVDISGLKKLQFLDIRSNRISRLPKETRNHIDWLLQNGIPVRVDMSNTPIYCGCENLEFLKWMTSSKAFDHTFIHYQCMNQDSSIITISDGYNSTLSELRRRCRSHTILFLTVSSGMVLLLTILIGVVVYRFRWRLRYLYYAAYLHYRKLGSSREDGEFKYDAFISYDHKDEKFVRETLSVELENRGLKICMHDRDFTAGDYIASNIVKAICSSRKTLVVLTNNMVTSYWCGYEIQMANMESIHTGRSVLVFLLMEEITKNVSTELRYNICNNTYVTYPDQILDVTTMDRFWNKLTFDIKD